MENGVDWRSKEAKQRINTSYSLFDRTREKVGRRRGERVSEKRRRVREKETNGIAAQDSYPKENQGYSGVLDYSRHDDDLRVSRLSVP